MQFFSAAESRAWAAKHGFQVNDAFGRPIYQDLVEPLVFTIPEDAGRRVALARVLCESAGPSMSDTLLWVTDWSIWPSGEHLPMADAVRRALGAPSALDESPGHLARIGEEDDALSILCAAILFLWDCWLLPSHGRRATFISHDEFGVVEMRGGDAVLAARLEYLDVLKDARAI